MNSFSTELCKVVHLIELKCLEHLPFHLIMFQILTQLLLLHIREYMAQINHHNIGLIQAQMRVRTVQIGSAAQAQA